MNIIILRTNSCKYDSRVKKIAEALVEKHTVTILAWDREKNYNKLEKYYNSSTKKIRVIRFGIKANYGDGIKKIYKYLKYFIKVHIWLFLNKYNYSAIHACDFDTAIIGIIYKMIFNKILVYDIFDYYADSFNLPKNLKFFIKSIDRLIMRFSNYVILCNEQRIKQIGKIKNEKIVIIHNSPPEETYELKENLENHKTLNICYIGILGKNRLIIELLNIIKNEKKYHLILGGFGEYENLARNYSKKYSNIEYLGKLPYEKVLEIETNSDLLIATYNPSIVNHKYSAPNKFYEALMFGIPIIVCKGMGIDNIITQYKLGVAILYDENDLKRGLEEIYINYSIYKENSKNIGKMLYKNKYSWNIMKKRLDEIYVRKRRIYGEKYV